MAKLLSDKLIDILRVHFAFFFSFFFFLFSLATHMPVRWRFKSKRKVATPPSVSLDIYLNPQMGNQTQNERSNRSDACSSPQIRPPNTPTRSSSADDNVVKSTNFWTGLNEKGNFLVVLYISKKRCLHFSIFDVVVIIAIYYFSRCIYYNLRRNILS